MNDIEWHNEKRKLSDLTPTDYNPRYLSKEDAKALRESLQRFNLAEIPAVNTNNQIIAGHQRIKILKDLKGNDHEIDVRIPSRELSEEELREYLIRSNKNTGAWDWDELANHFSGEELEEWGFTEEELFDYSEDEFGEDFDLPDGEKEPFQQMAFILADEQADVVRRAISDTKQKEEFKYVETFGNENQNANALYFIIQQWVESKTYA